MIKCATLIVLSVVATAISQAADAAQFAYVTNNFDGTVSVIDASTNAVVATVPVRTGPSVVAVSPTGNFVYVGHQDFLGGGGVSVIDTATNTVVAQLNTDAVLRGLARCAGYASMNDRLESTRRSSWQRRHLQWDRCRVPHAALVVE
jgi:YVTN family beta-propeller protein